MSEEVEKLAKEICALKTLREAHATIAAQAKELRKLKILKGTGKCEECPFNPYVGQNLEKIIKKDLTNGS